MATTPFVFTQANTGSGEETVNISFQYLTTQITITGLATGTAEIRAKAKGSDILEDVQDGVITLSDSRTLIIESTSIEQIGITVSAGTAYTVEVRQTDKRFS
jgi:hypothetical protein